MQHDNNALNRINPTIAGIEIRGCLLREGPGGIETRLDESRAHSCYLSRRISG